MKVSKEFFRLESERKLRLLIDTKMKVDIEEICPENSAVLPL